MNKNMIWLLLGGVAIYLLTRKKSPGTPEDYYSAANNSGTPGSPKSFEMTSLDLSSTPLNLPGTPISASTPNPEQIKQRDDALALFIYNQKAARPVTRPGLPVYYDPTTTPKAPVQLFPGEQWYWVASGGFWNITKV